MRLTACPIPCRRGCEGWDGNRISVGLLVGLLGLCLLPACDGDFFYEETRLSLSVAPLEGPADLRIEMRYEDGDVFKTIAVNDDRVEESFMFSGASTYEFVVASDGGPEEVICGFLPPVDDQEAVSVELEAAADPLSCRAEGLLAELG